MSKSSQNAAADVFTAIAHPVRRQILDRLTVGSVTVTELAEPFDISRPAISQHLSILLQSGLVGKEKRGRENFYSLNPDSLQEVQAWLLKYRAFWNEKLDALEAFLDRMDDENEE